MADGRTRRICFTMKTEVIVPSRPTDPQTVQNEKETLRKDTKEIENREIRKKELCQYISDYIKED